MIPDYWQHASAALAQHDPVMAGLVERFSGGSLVSRGDPFVTLARSIVGQQISVKAADSVWLRLSTALPLIAPAQLLASDSQTLRACGLSARKVEYLGDLARHFSSGEIHLNRWSSMSDTEIIAELTAVRGIGELGRNVPDLQPAAPRRFSARRHRSAESRCAALFRR